MTLRMLIIIFYPVFPLLGMGWIFFLQVKPRTAWFLLLLEFVLAECIYILTVKGTFG